MHGDARAPAEPAFRRFEAVMPRTGFVLTAIAATMSYALAGCSVLKFDLSQQRTPPPSPQTVQFESEPTGADVRTAQGETCQTPCSLALPVESQSVIFAKDGFVSQTVLISVDQPAANHSFFSKRPSPILKPNPVKVLLLVAPPPQPFVQVAPPLAQPAPTLAHPAPPSRDTIPWFPS
jgi:hypothetical protein